MIGYCSKVAIITAIFHVCCVPIDREVAKISDCSGKVAAVPTGIDTLF